MSVHRVMRLLFTSAACAMFAHPVALQAQGFGVNEIGSCALARGFAVTAAPCADGSALYWNPAAAVALPKWTLSAGVAAIALKGSFQQDTTFRKWEANAPTQPVPHGFLNYHPTGSQWAIGTGLYVPYGLTSEWPDSFPGRFSAKKASLQTFYVPLNFAWQINDKWSIGGGPVFGHSKVELIQAVDLSQQLLPTGQTFAQIGIATGTEFARAHLNGTATAWGAQIGVSGHPSPNWMVGARYLSALEFKYDNATATFDQVNTGLIVGGDLPGPTPQTTIKAGTPIDALVGPQFQSGGALVTQSASTKITHPAQAQAGVAYSGFQRWLLEADYAWVGWKRFDALPITFNTPALNRNLIEQYNNTSSIRLGAEYTVATDGWRLRAGFVGTASAAPPETVTPLLPEQDRSYVMFGAGVPLWKKLTIDGSYAHIATPGSRGRIVERNQTSQTAAQLNSGVFDLSANVVSVTFKLNF